DNRLKSWNLYHERLRSLEEKGCLELPKVPVECNHNGHMYFIKLNNLVERTDAINYLKEKGISAMFHYVPLHSSKAGLRFGRFCGEDKFTTKESERLLRLPLYYGLSTDDINFVCDKIKAFLKR
ncbi:partial dTDP-4-amino-4,6-dideoxygalactose transaminase, partial [Patescibacteria group bacterium]